MGKDRGTRRSTFRLGESVLSKLKALAQKKNTTMTAILEHLVEQAFQSENDLEALAGKGTQQAG